MNKKHFDLFNKIAKSVNNGDDKGGDNGDDKGGDDGDDKGGRNKNLKYPLYYNTYHDYRSYEKDFNKITPEWSKEDFLEKFKNKINSLINLPFKENRGTKEEAEARKNRKNNTINLASNLYNKL